MAATSKRQHDVKAKLLEALTKIDRPGEVCLSGDRPLVMPGLEVDGLGTVGLPLGESQAVKLMELCRQAPYGKGTETLVDTDVRRVWELDPAQFQLTNPDWRNVVTSIVQEVQQEFGLGDRQLEPHLYKLLVYEEGSFFLPHRDGEKLDRMVATLVISLPSVHTGGELIVSHEGRQQEICFAGAASGYELSYAAFYADCRHEVRPVTSGYRLCLTYNVTLGKSRGKQGLAAPSYAATTTAISELLLDWHRESDQEKLAISLEHRYTQDGLTSETLKGTDRTRADVLLAAAERAGLMAHLALLTLWQHGSAEEPIDVSRYRYRRARRSKVASDDASGETAKRHRMGEIYEHRLAANHWLDRNGNRVSFGEIDVQPEEIVAREPVGEGDPSCEDFEGYTGNAGMTLQRWYHRAAVIIWPLDKHFQVLCSAGTEASIGGLQTLVSEWKRAPKSAQESYRQDGLVFARGIIESWQTGSASRWVKDAEETRRTFSALLCELDDPELARQFLSQVMPHEGDLQLDRFFFKLCKKHGWAEFETALLQIVESSSATTIVRNAELLRTLCQIRDKDRLRIELGTRLAGRFVDVVQEVDQTAEKDWRIRNIDRTALFSAFVAGMLAIGAEEPLARLISYTLDCDKYLLTETHLATIFGLEKQLAKITTASNAVSRWLSVCRSELACRTAEAPEKPADYWRSSELSCDCDDCAALSAFLSDRSRWQARFPLAKARRRHLHDMIDRHQFDCTHVTEHIGRPYTLVCTKTTASYDAACKIYERDQQSLARLTRLQQKIA